MKETTTLAAVLTSLLCGDKVSEFFAENPWLLLVSIAAVIGFWFYFFRKPAKNEGAK